MVAEVDGSTETVAAAEAHALALMDSELQSLRGFGAAKMLPKKELTLADLRNEGVEASRLLSPADSTMDTIRKVLLAILGLGGALLLVAFQPALTVFIRLFFVGFVALLVDQVVNKGVLETVVVDSVARMIDQDYATRVAQHEAGHFLVAYLLGVLPKAYTLSSADALVRYQSPNVQAGCVFCDSAFRREVAAGSISAQSLDRFVCVALAGVAVEYLRFGQAKGGVTDIQQVETVLQSLGFDQRKANAQVRWSVLNTVILLRQHEQIFPKLADAMAKGASIGECISLIEVNLSATA